MSIQPDAKWLWMMNYCKVNGLAPAQKEHWDEAEQAYNNPPKL